MKLVKLEIITGFRGIQSSFAINFQRPAKNIHALEPVCLVGLNGSGKSNVMEALAEIFFYLEAIHHEFASKHIVEKSPFGFVIHYKQPVTYQNVLNSDQDKTWQELGEREVIITKRKDEKPEFEYLYESHPEPVSLTEKEETQKLLPSNVVGYSSGMNELISNPFLKMDFFYFDDYEKKRRGKDFGNIELNRFFFMDYESNGAVLLSNYLVHKSQEKKEEPASLKALQILNKIIRVDDLDSFRVVINYPIEERNRKQQRIELPREIRQFIDQLENCSTTLDETLDKNLGEPKGEQESDEAYEKRIRRRIEFYYKVNGKTRHGKATRLAFADQFGTPHELFRRLHLLKLLNVYGYSNDLREKVKKAGLGTNISELLPKHALDERVFFIDKINFKTKEGKILRYKQLSDGEHQYLHVVGTLMLMDNPGTLFLLDEPETHFNPDWRSKLMSTLNEVILLQQEELKREASKGKKTDRLQEVMITTHSPFIISNCQPENVNIMYRDDKTGEVKSKPPDINTYGASANVLLKSIFNRQASIPDLPLQKIKDLEKELKDEFPDFERIKTEIARLGESVEKFMLQDYLYRIESDKEGEKDA